MNLRNRVKKLEDHIIKPVEFGTSKIAINDEAEMALHDRCMQIIDSKGFENLTESEHKTLDAMGKIMDRRASDVYLTVKMTLMESLAGEKMMGMFTFMRFFWFEYELQRWALSLRKERELEEKYAADLDHADWDGLDKAWKEYADQLDNKTQVFTLESWDWFYAEFFEKSVAASMKKSMKEHPEAWKES